MLDVFQSNICRRPANVVKNVSNLSVDSGVVYSIRNKPDKNFAINFSWDHCHLPLLNVVDKIVTLTACMPK